jgi:hypothetical protein
MPADGIGVQDKLFMVAADELTRSRGDIYIGSPENLNLVSVNSSEGNVHLVTDKSVISLLTERVPVITGVDLYIQAGGDIGIKS